MIGYIISDEEMDNIYGSIYLYESEAEDGLKKCRNQYGYNENIQIRKCKVEFYDNKIKKFWNSILKRLWWN